MLTAERDRVAFVILTWNSDRYISECLASIAACEGLDSSVYLVDNGSSDGTLALVESFGDALALDVVRLPQNAGTTVSRNLALRKVDPSCDFVCILDSDTVVNEAAIEALITTLRDDKNIGLVGPLMENRKGELQRSGRNLPTIPIKLAKGFPVRKLQEVGSALEEPKAPVLGGLQDVPYLLSACWMIRSDTLRDVGLLDEKIFYAPEDVDYCVRVWLSGRRVVLCHEAKIIHDYQRISKKKLISAMNVEHIRGLFYYFGKYHYAFRAPDIMGCAHEA